MSNTVSVGKMKYSVEIVGTDSDGLPRYSLVGTRGARYTTLRKKNEPQFLFILRSDNRPVWFVEREGTLEFIQAR